MARTNDKRGAEKASKPDPFAGKSKAERTAAIKAAKATDEAAAGKRTAGVIEAMKAARARPLQVDKRRQDAAYALLKRLERETVEWLAAKSQKGSTPQHTDHVQALRAKKKVTQRQLNMMRGKDCDSVQAAENVFYAEREATKVKADAEDAAARRIVAAAKRKAVEELAAKAKA